MRSALLSIVFSSCFLLAAAIMPAKAAGQRFFEALYDVPVMAGLEEVPAEAMLFDKPDGRIASVVAGSKTLKPVAIRAFYAETLAQLGWKKLDENQYVRGGDQLDLEITGAAPLTLVRFTLSPVRP
ncbi:MAG: hypothetical protein WC989_08515 [Micavibrio sp.]